MKKGRKLAGILIAVVLTLAMGMTTFAASITITPKEEQGTNHVYKVYQIFTGTEYTDDDDNPGLTDVEYGQNYHPGTSKEGDKVPETVLDEIKNAREEAQNEFIKNLYDEENPVATLSAGNNYKADGLTPGYYLIVDTIDGVMKKGDALSAYIVQVLHEEEIDPKVEFPKLSKEITGEDGTGDENDTDEQTGDKDELDIGDTVEFTLTGKVSENAGEYRVYFWNAEDTLSKGLTLNTKGETAADSDFTVKVDGKKLTPGTEYNVVVTSVTNEEGENETHFSLALTPAGDNWSEWAGKTVTIEYSATLNENAVIGEAGNPNTEHLEYASDPEWDNGGTPGPLKDGRPAEGVDIPTGVTPDQTTYTYTTGIKIYKVDEEDNTLLGAEFTITGNGMNIVLNEKKEFKEDPSGEYYKLKSKTGEPESYTKREPQLEDQMRPATDRNGGYVVDSTASDDDEGVITVGGTKYRPATDAELKDSDVALFVLMKANAEEYENTTTKYSATVTYEQVGEPNGVNVKAYVDAEGAVTFNGLGVGTYTITESKTPEGFNTIDPFDVTITWEADKTGDKTKCEWKATCDGKDVTETDEGTFTFTIENRHGNTLPETGGIGTTIFYIVGAILVIGAGVLLIAKKRMNSQK